MSRRRTYATRLNDLKDLVQTIKQQTSTQIPQVYSPGNVLMKYSFKPSIILALINLKLITMSSETGQRSRKYQWIYGSTEISDQMIKNLHDAYIVLESKRVNEYAARVKTKGKVNRPSQSNPNNTKVTKDVYPDSPFNGVNGTIFGYKQLKFMGSIHRNKPAKVLIDDRYTVENVALITFTVDKSKLTVTFYMYSDQHEQPDLTSKIAEFNIDNAVLAFRDGFTDSTSSSLVMTTVPVKDPYNIR